jgi:hypothetical protein
MFLFTDLLVITKKRRLVTIFILKSINWSSFSFVLVIVCYNHFTYVCLVIRWWHTC